MEELAFDVVIPAGSADPLGRGRLRGGVLVADEVHTQVQAPPFVAVVFFKEIFSPTNTDLPDM